MFASTIAKVAVVALAAIGAAASEDSVNLPRLADCALFCGSDVCTPGATIQPADPSCQCLFGPTRVNPYVASCMELECPRNQRDVAFGTLYTYCSRHSP
ncbi:hypothetical protein EV122DRAFT_282789 [Schizophyllum commune]